MIFLHKLFAIRFHHVIRPADSLKNPIRPELYRYTRSLRKWRASDHHSAHTYLLTCLYQILPLRPVLSRNSPGYFMCEGALVICPSSVWMSPLLPHCTDTAGSLIPAELEKNWALPRRSAHFMLKVAARAERQGWRKVQKASRLPAAGHGRIEPLSGRSL